MEQEILNTFTAGDTVSVETFVGVYQYRIGSNRVAFTYRIGNSLKGRMISFYERLVRCRTVLTEKTINMK